MNAYALAAGAGMALTRGDEARPAPARSELTGRAGPRLGSGSAAGPRDPVRPVRHAWAPPPDGLTADAGTAEALGLVPATAGVPPGQEVPAQVRLAQAWGAIRRLSGRLARLEQQREAARGDGVAALDRAIGATRRRLQIAELAERATMAELAGPPRGSGPTRFR